MKKLFVVLSLMSVFCFQMSASALTRMTDEQMDGVTAQAGIQSDTAQNQSVTPLGWLTESGLEALMASADASGLSLGVTRTDIRIEDAVIDIGDIEFVLLRTEAFTMGHIIIDGIHMEIGSAEISIWSNYSSWH